MRVLVVEDELPLAQNVASALREGPGLAVDCAEDGETGLALRRIAVMTSSFSIYTSEFIFSDVKQHGRFADFVGQPRGPSTHVDARSKDRGTSSKSETTSLKLGAKISEPARHILMDRLTA